MDLFPWFSRRRFGSFGAAALCTSALLLLATCCVALGAGEPGPVMQASTEPARLPPALEGKLPAIVQKMVASKKQMWEERMYQLTAEIEKVTGLPHADAAALAAPTRQAIDECLKTYAPSAQDGIREFCEQPDPRLVESSFAFLEANAASASALRLTVGQIRPWEHPIWTAAVDHVLNPAQRVIWKTAARIKAVSLENSARAIVKTWVQSLESSTVAPLLAMAQETSRTLALSAERAEKLRLLVTAAAEKRAAALQAFGEKMVRADDTPSLDRFYPTTVDGQRMVKIPTAYKEWEASLATVLAPAELERYQAMKEEHRQRQARLLADVFIAVMDERVALTEAQRKVLQPIALRIVREEPALWTPDGWIIRPLYPQRFYRVGTKTIEADTAGILDERQRQRWAAVVNLKPVDLVEPTKRDLAPREPEQTESELSDLFFSTAEATRAACLSEITLISEDIIRTSAPSPEIRSRLTTAARGTVERQMDSWRTTVETETRAALSQMEFVDGSSVARFRSTIRSYQGRRGEPLATTPPWPKTIETTLTSAQREIWQKEVEARKEFVARTATHSLLVNFDTLNSLSASQWDALEPLVRKATRDPSLGSAFQPDSIAWQRTTPYAFLPFLLLEKELKSILTEEQFKAWTGGEDYKAAQETLKRLQEQKKQNIINLNGAVLRG